MPERIESKKINSLDWFYHADQHNSNTRNIYTFINDHNFTREP